ncbi:MAG: response regulator [Saprospiraceae bacterium]|nr:response regulator [Saprospiraceae bacterium]
MLSVIKVLIVEDSPLQAETLSIMLRQMGYDVVAKCSSGEDALKKFEEHEPDLVLLDIKLHGPMTGVDVGKAIMNSRPVPHIYLSAWLDEFPDVVDTLPNAVFSKPYNEGDLHRNIQLAIQNYAQRIEPEAANNPERIVFPGVIISRDCLWIKQRSEARERFFKLPVDDIRYIKSDNVYLNFYIKNRDLPIVIVMRISEFTNAIRDRDSYHHIRRVGMSHLVNVRDLKSFTRTLDVITMNDDYEIRVSEPYRDSLRSTLEAF